MSPDNAPQSNVPQRSAGASPPAPPLAKRRRRWLVLGSLGALLIALVVFHVPLLCGVADFLVVDEPLRSADYVVVLPNSISSDVTRDTAVQLYRDGTVHGIVVLAPEPSRPVQYGAWPAPASLFRAALIEKVPAAAITVLADCGNDWECLRGLGELKAARGEQARLIVLCPRFLGRFVRYVFHREFAKETPPEVTFHALPSDSTSEDWWHSRVGIQEIFHQYTKLAFAHLAGQSKPCRGAWDYEEFLKNLPAAEASR